MIVVRLIKTIVKSHRSKHNQAETDMTDIWQRNKQHRAVFGAYHSIQLGIYTNHQLQHLNYTGAGNRIHGRSERMLSLFGTDKWFIESREITRFILLQNYRLYWRTASYLGRKSTRIEQRRLSTTLLLYAAFMNKNAFMVINQNLSYILHNRHFIIIHINLHQEKLVQLIKSMNHQKRVRITKRNGLHHNKSPIGYQLALSFKSMHSTKWSVIIS